MALTDRYDSIGSEQDQVELRIAGEAIKIWSEYEIHTSVFSQPGAFSLHVGWGDVARELLEIYHPNASFELRVGNIVIMTGVLDTPDVPSGDATQLQITGRDAMAALFDDHLEAEKSFSESSYYDLTRKMLDAVGLQGRTILPDNTANRKAVTGHTVKEIARPVSGEQVDVEQAEAGKTDRKVVYKTIKAQLTESRWTFLEREYKKSGLFLWASGEGNYILARPNPAQVAGYLIQRERGMLRNAVNVTDHRFHRTKVNRFARTICYGSTGGGKRGRCKVRAIIEDPEMISWGCTNTKAFSDPDAKSDREANYIARRDVAQQRRDGWQLEYTLSGHAVWSRAGNGGVAVWGIDTMCEVEDHELGIYGDLYVSDVTFKGGLGGTSTTVRLMRPEDLLFSEDEDPAFKAHLNGQPKQWSRAKPTEAARTVAVDWEAELRKGENQNYWWNRTKGKGFKPAAIVMHRDPAEEARQEWLMTHATPQQVVALNGMPGVRTF